MKKAKKGQKWCSYHRRFESIDVFSANRTTKDGLQDVCKEAQSVLNAQYYSEHRTAMLAKNSVWVDYSKGNISEINKAKKYIKINNQYGIKNKKRILEQAHA